jgi:hypothetical protein
MIVRHDNRAKAGSRFDDGARERRQVFRMPDARVNEHSAARTDDEVGVVPCPGHRSGISRVEDDWRKALVIRTSSTVSQTRPASAGR